LEWVRFDNKMGTTLASACVLCLDLVRVANSKARIKPTAPLSAFDKENLIEFLLNSLLLIHFTTVAMCLLSHGPHVTLVM